MKPYTDTGLRSLADRAETDDVYENAARERLTRPLDYARWVDDGMFVTWGYAGIGQHRDSDAIDRSNYRTVLRDLTALEAELYGAEASSEWLNTESASHWAVGWIESITVRVLVDADAGPVIDNLTPLFIAAVNIAITLREQYPIWDEFDHSEEESAEHHEVWTNCVWPDFRRPFNYRDNVPEGITGAEVLAMARRGELRDETDYLDWLDTDEVMHAVSECASELDPSTWEDWEIMAGVVRVVEAFAWSEAR